MSVAFRPSIKDGLLAEYDHEMASTRRLLERLRDDRLSWKPHDKSMSMGGLGTHLANLPNWGDAIVNLTGLDLATLPPPLTEKTSSAAILAAFDEAVARTRGFMDKTDAEWMAPWTLARGTHEIFSVPRVTAFRSWVIGHSIHHRGQLSVYLRLNDIPVPPVYGPTADEG
jgi:uncharacterized damage-inducible protein DinB